MIQPSISEAIKTPSESRWCAGSDGVFRAVDSCVGRGDRPTGLSVDGPARGSESGDRHRLGREGLQTRHWRVQWYTLHTLH